MPNPPTHLRCEYEVDPLGLDTPQPRLSWWLNDDARGARQSAYQVVVKGGPAGEPGDTLWDSGRVQSDHSIQVPYGGPALRSRQRCQWQVRTWNGTGEASGWSEPASWEMGLLQRADWHGQWIAAPIVGGPYSIPAAAYLRKEFTVARRVVQARLYVTALGLYEFEVNGQKVGTNQLAPGRTEYTKRVPYHTYDVTSLVGSGANGCGAILGDGWYCGHLHSDPRQTYGDRPKLLAQLELQFADGTTQIVATDPTWLAGEGPIRSSDLLMGEDYDARLEIPGWSAPGFTPKSAWVPAVPFDEPAVQVVAHRAPPIRKTHEVKPVAPPVASANKRRHIFDFGQNMVGHVRLRVRNAAPGQVIDLRHVEMLDKDGKPYVLSLRTARAIDHYTTRGSGGGEETFEPRFTFHGFRYVEVRDYPGGNPTVDDVTGVVVHSDMEATGSFECSDPMLNQLQSNIVWSQRGNFLDIPTDCPQRDERLGWTGDAQVFIRTAAFNMDVANFFAKWLTDMADSQGDDGRIPSVVPSVTSIYGEGGPAWADAAVICPWWVYRCYGDDRILADCWPMMTRFLTFLEERCVNFIRCDEHWKWKGYGDWLSMNADTPADLIGTAFYAYCAGLMSRIATVLKRPDDAARYARLEADVRAAWQKRFVTPDGMIVAQTQTAYVLALHFDLLPESLRPRAVDLLVANIKGRGWHLSTGFVGTPYLNPVLTRFGRADVAFKLLQQRTFPSWLYPITQGATTMWERWDSWTHEKGFSDTGMNSFNHYAYGAVGEWIYATIGGIDLDPAEPAYRKLLVAPRIGGGLAHARCRLDSMYGPVECNWKLQPNGSLDLDLRLPPNTVARVRVPTRQPAGVTESGQPIASLAPVTPDGDAFTIEIDAGIYHFNIPEPVIV
jgi:alpha-L-rhamnosidase